LGLAVAIAVAATTADPAEARQRRKRAPAYQPPYASIVVDANSGAVLESTSPDSRRHPASLTKIMTLYLLFERLESGQIKLDTPLRVSASAASQAPTKLGLKPGSTIAVEDAIKAVVTKSANDAAVVIAEAIAGDEDAFAEQMTRKAHSLGMTRTVYRNASGLPDADQVTTAREQALLGRAIRERFPRFYKYFATSAFVYRGHAMRNHNKLLGSVEGVDGIKTGYTRASGFNLVTSVRRGNRHIVAVVLGGSSAGARDERMRTLISAHIGSAATKRTAAVIGERPEPKVTRAAPRQAVAVAAAERTDPVSTATISMGQTPSPGSSDPITPRRVKTIAYRSAANQTATLGRLPPLVPVETPAPVPPSTIPERTQADVAPSAGASAAHAASAAIAPQVAAADRSATPAANPIVAPVPRAKVAHAPAPAKRVVRSGWLIQVGAFPLESEAKERLQSAQAKAKTVLRAADPFTEPVVKGDTTLYRARFAGFDKNQAEAACKQLRRNDIACLTVKN
jgi:D-alanyl-D-alanine carboxypeptidase